MSPRRASRLARSAFAAAFLLPAPALGYQSYLVQAKKFGGKDCLFCHDHELGGEGWNDRGRWLMQEKARRRADTIDVAWLADYKPAPESSATPGVASRWPRFRGPNGTGIASGARLPLTWSAAEGIAWKAAIPGLGNSSPVVWDDRVFLQSAAPDGKERSLLCLDLASGVLRWSRALAGSRAPTNPRNTLASSTPAVDGERVYALVWDGAEQTLAAWDVDGKPVWSQGLGPLTTQHGAGHSPVVHRNRVIVVNDSDVAASVLAFDSATGKPAWSAARKHFNASYSTPFILERADRADLVVTSTAGITGYDPETGRERWHWTWRFPGAPLRTVASAVWSGTMIFATSGDGGGARHMVALRLEGTRDEVRPAVAWESTRLPYVPTMLVWGEHLYWVNDLGIAGCNVAATGESVWTERLGGNVIASPVLAGGRIYAANDDGDVFVFAAAPKFELLARNSVGEMVRATPAVAGERLLVRGRNHLFCVGEPSRPLADSK